MRKPPTITGTPHGQLVHVLCPFCGQTHLHGISRDLAADGVTHRLAHCVKPSTEAAAGYFIKLAKEATHA